MFFPEIAYAQNASAGAQGGLLMTILPLLIMIAVFYFLVMRPQINREKERQQMQSSLKRGDSVITSGGIIGKVTKLEDNQYILIKLAEGVEVRMARSNIEGVVETGIPAQKNDQKTKKSGQKASQNTKNTATTKKAGGNKTSAKSASQKSSNNTSGNNTSGKKTTTASDS